MSVGGALGALASLAVLLAAGGWRRSRAAGADLAPPTRRELRRARPDGRGNRRRIGSTTRVDGDRDGRVGLEHLRASLQGGWSLVGALRRLADDGGPWSREAAAVLADRGDGEALQVALDRWAAQDRRPAVTVGVDALAVAGATGASQAAALDAALRVVDERRAVRAEVLAATAPQRGSAAVLVAVPIGFAVLVSMVDRRVAALYVRDPIGWGCALAGAVLDGLGALWFRRLLGSVR